MTNVGAERRDRKTTISDYEFNDMMTRADNLPGEIYRLRTRAALSLMMLTGKRRSEIVTLQLSDFEQTPTEVNVTFTLSKKRRKTAITMRSTKTIPMGEPLLMPILEYLMFLNKLSPKPTYFMPRLIPRMGKGQFIVVGDSHIGGRALLNSVRRVSEIAWCHLFRETVASRIIAEDPSLMGAFKVQRRLDLEDIQTGFNYFKRWSVDRIERDAKPQQSAPIA